MEPIKQENSYGCGIACIAFILKTDYETTVSMIENGKYKAEHSGFFCKELTNLLNSKGRSYEWKYIKQKISKKIYATSVIVFVKRSKKYPAGHYLVRHEDAWMDSWINFPHLPVVAGFRKRLPGKAIYAILPKH